MTKVPSEAQFQDLINKINLKGSNYTYLSSYGNISTGSTTIDRLSVPAGTYAFFGQCNLNCGGQSTGDSSIALGISGTDHNFAYQYFNHTGWWFVATVMGVYSSDSPFTCALRMIKAQGSIGVSRAWIIAIKIG